MSFLVLKDKPELKEKAVGLRRNGRTYSEILKEVDVSKSTLSLWFHDVGLAEHQKQRITQKRIDGQKKAAEARRSQRINLQNHIWSVAEKEIGSLSKRELWLIGIALYWAEGSKEKEWRTSGKLIFSNSDPRMLRVFLAWLREFGDVKEDEIKFEICIHENKKDDLTNVVNFWSKETGFPLSFFSKIYFKKHKIHTKRKNIGVLYNGLIRVSIPRSLRLVRKIEGWSRGISNNCRLV